MCLAAWLAPLALTRQITQPQSLSDRWEMARDPSGQRTVQDMAAQQFARQDGPLALGFSPDVVWLRFTLSQPEDAPTDWRLHVTPAFLEHVQLYAPLADGSFQALRGGALVAVAERAVVAREISFPLQLSSTPTTYYLRLHSRTTLSMDAALMSPKDLVTRSMLQSTRHGIFLGLLLSSVLISMLCALWLRESFLYIGTAYLACFGLAQLSLNGYDRYVLSQLWPTAEAAYRIPLPGLYSCLLAGLHGLFVLSYLQAREPLRHLRRGLGLASVLGFVCAGLALIGFWGRVGPWFYGLAVVIAVLILSLSIAMLRYQPQRAKLMLIMFTPGLIGAVLQSSRNIGVLPLNFWTTELWTAMAFIQVPFAMVIVLLRVRETYQLATEARVHEQLQRSLLDMMAHELRTPLAVVSTAVANLEARTLPAQPDLQPRYQRLRTALARLNSVVDNALGQQKLNDPNLRFLRVPTAPSALLEQVRGLLAQDEKHSLRFTPSANDEALALDPHWVALAVVNLVDNAIKYSPNGGAIEVALQRDAVGLRIEVSDQGIGLPPEALGQLFDRFYRAPNATALTTATGMGLGLFLVQQVALGHGGTVRAENLPAGGSRFTLDLKA